MTLEKLARSLMNTLESQSSMNSPLIIATVRIVPISKGYSGLNTNLTGTKQSTFSTGMSLFGTRYPSVRRSKQLWGLEWRWSNEQLSIFHILGVRNYMMKSLPFTPFGSDADTRTTKAKRSKQEDLNIWVANLVTKQNDDVLMATSKSERIEKRLAKRRRTDETKNKLRNKSKKVLASIFVPAIDSGEGQVAEQPMNEPRNSTNCRIKSSRSPQLWRIQSTEISKQIELCLHLIKEKRKSWQKPYTPVHITSHNTSKRRRQQLANQMDNWFQPRRSNYGGIGLARPSLFIAFDDPSWQAKFEEEFLEHVPGFYGKQRTKAMKKQLDGQMLWRQLQKQKLAGSSTLSSSKNPNQLVLSGKKLSNLKPDERVEALIRSGYI
jgi:hypothetical protein